MACPRWLPVAIVLASGKVLVAGGTYNGPPECRRTTEIYDPAANTWVPGPIMAFEHGSGLEAAALPSGAWLVAGGEAAKGEVVASAELFE